MAYPDPNIVISDTALSTGETALVTFTFDQVVSGFDNADLTIANGTLTPVSTSDGLTYTATFTPTSGITSTSNVIIFDNAGVLDAGGVRAGDGSSISPNYAIDTAAPAVGVVVADPDLATGETSLVTFTFSEAVTGFTNANLAVENGTLSTVTTADGGITWTGTLTPTAAVNDATNIITVDKAGVTDVAGNVATGTTDSNNYVIDSVPPTVAIVVADNSLTVGETTAVTFTFSEAVTGFTASDVAAGNAAVSNFTAQSTTVYTATLTPTVGTTGAGNLVSIDGAGFADIAGNTGGTHGISNAYDIDTARPTAAIVLAHTTLHVGETSTVAITFSEAVTGFDNADITVQNGTLSTVTTSDNVTFTGVFTPAASLNDSTNVITIDHAGLSDLAGNAGTGTSTSANYVIDTTPAPDPTPAPVANLPGSSQPDVIVGNDLNNAMTAGDGDDTATGGIGNDTISGDAGDDVVQGNTGADDVFGGTGNDVVLGGQGDDRVQGNPGSDYVSGDKGDDMVYGGQGVDTVYGGEGDDYVSGDLGDDVVRGGQGDDRVFGGDGDDYVSGDRGSDTITGGLGADLFHGSSTAGLDMVTDFSRAQGDRVILDLGTSYTLSQIGADTVIDMGGGNQMTLANVQLSTLTPGWIFLG